MKGGVALLLAVKYLWRYRRRYFFLFLALAFGFGVISTITSLKAGMTSMLYRTAQTHYAGDIIAMGYARLPRESYHLDPWATDAILGALPAAGIEPSRVVMRTNFMNEAALFYGGSSVRLKYVTGVDWDAEAAYFASLDYAEPPRGAADQDAIFISAPVAERLGARRGESLILEVKNRFGQKDTRSFVVAGVINDSSIFGYFKSYISRGALNRLLGYGEGDCSSIGLFLPARKAITAKQAALREQIAARLVTAPLMLTRDDFSAAMRETGAVPRVFVLTLELYLSDVSRLLGALDALSYLLYAMMLAAVFVSALVTYRLILFERTRELGTMRVIGFQEPGITAMLGLEALCLTACALVFGFAFSLLLNKGVSFIPFNQVPGFEIFMQDGRLAAAYSVRTVLFNAGLVACVLLPALGFPAYYSSRGALPDMLRSQ